MRSGPTPTPALADERGAAAVEAALVFGIVLAIVLMSVHFGLLYNASLAVDDAAGEALEELADLDGDASQARAVAALILDSDGTVKSWSMPRAERTEQTATVTITGASSPVLPGLPTEVSRTVSGPVERFISEADR